MPAVCPPDHLEKANGLRRLLAAYTASEDLIRIGAYQKGNDPVLDQALAVMPGLNQFLEQTPLEAAPLAGTTARLLELPS